MTKEEVIKIFNEVLLFGKAHCTQTEFEELARMSIKALAQEPRWIPVSKRLPEEYEYVLCWYEYFRYGDYNCMYKTYGVGFYGDGHWGGDVTGHKVKVFAWMPLPEPYN